MKTPSVSDYKIVIENKMLGKRQLEILNTLFHAPNSCATEEQLAILCNYAHHSSASFQIGTIGKRIADALGIIPKEYQPGKREYYMLIGPYTRKNGWEMHENLKVALKNLEK